MNHAVLPLADARDKAVVGGKAWSLGELVRAGFLVPPGFVITADAELSDKTQAHILRSFDELGHQYVAVRSSAAAEDGHNAAWAGQLDTFLNVERDGLLAAVEQCRQSIHSERAQAYAQQKHLAPGPVAVVVQAMIQSEVSGVAFSVHPVTHDTQQIVIEAGLGLGEAVVSGQITPDTYICQKPTGKILENHSARQTQQLVLVNSKTIWQPLGDEGAAQKLPDQHMAALAQLVSRLEEHYGFPVDIEWALFDNKLYLLQSRPITTLAG